ncbi:hypothetical protein OR1_00492 [Geobacter sp. OR-1]|uniref:hypothetical protein n=1 Tax=Geobacter sp. OR-1 TaxID=1266765 RepID=UPI00054278F9|nr:hypothetical protein [Geobacter sp. OR-1]GAM08221.1 hypothetical protein OR1_00492 [Geobacter sp. OR-1]
MQKKMITLLAVAAFAVMGGTAFAALPNLDAGNTTMATELVHPTDDTAAPAAYIAYQVNGAVAPTTVLKLTLTNGTFANPMNICFLNGAVPTKATINSALNAAGTVNTLEIDPATTGLGVGTIYYIQDDNCVAVPAANASINVAGGTTAGSVSMEVNSVTIPDDAKIKASATVVTLKNQFSAQLVNAESIIDFGSLRTTLKADTCTAGEPPCTDVAGTVSSSRAKLLLFSDETINSRVAAAVAPDANCAGTYLAANEVTVKVTGDLTGIDAITYGDLFTNNGPVTTAVGAADVTAGFKTLTIPLNNVDVCLGSASPAAGKKTDLTLAVDTAAGSPAAPTLVAGNRTVEVKLVGGSALVAGACPAGEVCVGSRVLLAAGSLSHKWVFDGTQYYAPFVKFRTDDNGTTQTYFKVLSKNTTTGANGVTATVVCDDGTTSDVILADLEAGKTSTFTAGQIMAGLPGTCTVDGARGTGIILTVNAPEEDVFAYATITDVNGHKRLPLKAVNGQIVE